MKPKRDEKQGDPKEMKSCIASTKCQCHCKHQKIKVMILDINRFTQRLLMATNKK
jgi:hypothetical protein